MSLMQRVVRTAPSVATRAFSVTATNPAQDPVQKLFVDKLREYTKKSQSVGGKMVDVTKESTKALEQELHTVANSFRMKSPDEAFKFPEMKFNPPKIDSINVSS